MDNLRSKEAITAPSHSISAIAVVDLARVLSDLGAIEDGAWAGFAPELSPHVVRLRSGEDMSALYQRRFPEASLQKLWALGAESGIADLGLRVGQQVETRAQGLLASWVGHCATLRGALELYTDHVALLNARDSWDIQPQGDQAVLTSTLSCHDQYPAIACERSLVALVAWGRYFTTDQLRPVRVDIRSQAPAHLDKLSAFFGCAVSPGQDFDRLYMAKADLNQPIRSSNPYLKRVLDTHISRLSLDEEKPTTSKVQQLLHADLLRFAEVERVSATLCVSRSTLYRKLKTEGTSFSGLRDAERRFQALRMRDKSAEEIAYRLGYGDSSAYYKALKRWGEM